MLEGVTKMAVVLSGEEKDDFRGIETMFEKF